MASIFITDRPGADNYPKETGVSVMLIADNGKHGPSFFVSGARVKGVRGSRKDGKASVHIELAKAEEA